MHLELHKYVYRQSYVFRRFSALNKEIQEQFPNIPFLNLFKLNKSTHYSIKYEILSEILFFNCACISGESFYFKIF